MLLPATPLLLVLAGGVWFFGPHVRTERPDLVTQPVHFKNLQLTITERGTIQSSMNSDVVCKVKARSLGSTIATTIKWVIDEGAVVRRGQVLVELDDSGLQEDLKTQKIAVLQAQTAWVQAEENLKIVKEQDEGDIQTAVTAAKLAEMDLLKYIQGEYEQSKHDILGRLSQAEADLEMSREHNAWSRRMLKKGYLTPNQVRSDEAQEEKSLQSLKMVREELRILEKFTRKRTVTDLQSKRAEARRDLERLKAQGRSKEIQAEFDRRARRSIYDHEEKHYKEIEEQSALCTIRAPQDGVVVYAVSEQSRSGRGAQQGIVAQGEPVREGQVLMQVTDLSHMLVDTRVHEAMLPHVTGEQKSYTGFSEGVQAALGANPDLLSRFLGQAAFEGLRDHFHDLDYRQVRDGERVLIQAYAFPDRVLHGHVKQVGNVPSSRDWLLADVKVYQTLVSIDDSVEGLRPGMTADVTILADEPLAHVLAVPIEALTGPVKQGQPSKCFVLGSEGPEEREVKVGHSNETLVEISSGLQEGDEIVLNPTTLVREQQGIASH